MTSMSRPLGEPVLAHHPGRQPHALVGQLEVPVALDGEQPVALHPGHGLGHGRAALVQPLGDPGAQRDDALLDQLVDRPEVHLRGVDEVVMHSGVPAMRSAHAERPSSHSWGGHRPFCLRARTERWHGVGDGECHARHVVPPRPAARGQPRAARRRRPGRRPVLPLFVLDPALWRPAGPSRGAYLAAVAARPGRRSGIADCAVRSGDPVRRGRPGRAGGRRRPGARRRRLRPVRRRARRAVDAALAEHEHRAGPHRLAVRRRARAG